MDSMNNEVLALIIASAISLIVLIVLIVFLIKKPGFRKWYTWICSWLLILVWILYYFLIWRWTPENIPYPADLFAAPQPVSAEMKTAEYNWFVALKELLDTVPNWSWYMNQPLDGLLNIVRSNDDIKAQLWISWSTELWKSLEWPELQNAKENDQPTSILLTWKEFSENWNNRMKQLELGSSLFSGYIKNLASEVYKIVSSDKQFQDFLTPSGKALQTSDEFVMDMPYSLQLNKLQGLARTLDAIAVYNIAKWNYDVWTAYLIIGIELAKKLIDTKDQVYVTKLISLACYSINLSTLNLINQNFPLPNKNKEQLATLIKDSLDITGQINNMLASEYNQVFENSINAIEKSPVTQTIQQEYGINISTVFDKEKTQQVWKNFYATYMIRSGNEEYTGIKFPSYYEFIDLPSNVYTLVREIMGWLAEQGWIMGWLGMHTIQNAWGLILLEQLTPRREQSELFDRFATIENLRQQVYQELAAK